jgi:hypothetical protein
MTTDKCLRRLGEEYGETDGAECGDEGRMCWECGEKEAAYWGRYFGICPGMTRQESRDQLERVKPFDHQEQVDAWRLK